MSDYRRFIAYLYEYPNNRKGGCCGFVRVESQNDFCRMDFQIKSAALSPETSITVYGFIRRSGRMYGIPLGNLLAGRTSTSGKLFTRFDALGQTDVTLDQLGGLILLYHQTGVIATQWDDLPIQPEFFSPTLPKAEPEIESPADVPQKPNSEIESNVLPQPDPKLEPQTNALPDSEPLPAAAEPSQPELSTASVSEPELYPQNSTPESTTSTKSRKSHPAKKPESPHPVPDSAVPSLHMTSAEFPAATTAAPSRASLYLQLQDQFPRFHPFPDDDLTDCLRLSLDDLPMLRAAGLSTDANRFVLHGSASYRHLLLARNRDQQEIWYFGVPGVYTPNEQFMASLFGFFHFKQAMRPAELAPDARFGYWYRTL
ncbi:DUF6128 domain-containing protein [Fusicatenibacter sp.]